MYQVTIMRLSQSGGRIILVFCELRFTLKLRLWMASQWKIQHTYGGVANMWERHRGIGRMHLVHPPCIWGIYFVFALSFRIKWSHFLTLNNYRQLLQCCFTVIAELYLYDMYIICYTFVRFVMTSKCVFYIYLWACVIKVYYCSFVS